jgi:hypothetical protein
MDRLNDRPEKPERDSTIDPLKDLTMPESPGSIDLGPATQEELGPEVNRFIGDFRERLGLPRGPGFLDDSLSPPVDMELVRAYVERTLDPQRATEVFARSLQFRPWSQAVGELLSEKAREERVGDSRSEP